MICSASILQMSGGVTMVPRSTLSSKSESSTASTSVASTSASTTSSTTIIQQTESTSTTRQDENLLTTTTSSSISTSQSSRINKVNIRNKKNLRLKRRPTGVFTIEQVNVTFNIPYC